MRQKGFLHIAVLLLIAGFAVLSSSAYVYNQPRIERKVVTNIPESEMKKEGTAVPQTASVVGVSVPKREQEKDVLKPWVVKNPPGRIVKHLFNIYGAPNAKSAVFSKDGREIWVTLLMNTKNGVRIFDAESGKKIKDINLNGAGGVEIIITKDGKRAYASQMETGKVFEIDTVTKEILRVFNTNSTWTKVLELSADEKTLFASNWVSSNVTEFDLVKGGRIRSFATVTTPRGLYATRDGESLYVTGFEHGTIQKIDLASGADKVIINTGGAMRHFAADEERGILYASDMGKSAIWKVDLKNDAVEKFARTDINPNTIVLSPDKNILFVSSRGRNASATNYYIPGPEWGSVLLFDTNTGKVLDAIVAGNQPTALAVSPDGTRMVFSDFLDSRLEVFEIPSYEVLKAGNGGRSRVYKSELKK